MASRLLFTLASEAGPRTSSPLHLSKAAHRSAAPSPVRRNPGKILLANFTLERRCVATAENGTTGYAEIEGTPQARHWEGLGPFLDLILSRLGQQLAEWLDL